jgi:hypothetical protein
MNEELRVRSRGSDAVVFDARVLFEYAGLVWMAFLAFVFLY